MKDLAAFRKAAREWFVEMDFNLSGTIDKEELRIEFAKLGLPQATVDVFVQHFEIIV